MTLKESIERNTTKKGIREDAEASMVAANVQTSQEYKPKAKVDVKAQIEAGTNNASSAGAPLSKDSVDAITSGKDVFNRIANGANGVETKTLDESLASVGIKL